MSIAKWHPAAEAFPLLQGEELAKFVEDIRANGVRKPIEVYDGDNFPEFKGFGLDGRNRLAACRQLDIEPPTRFLTDVEVGSSLTSYVVSLNVARRHLSSSQAAIVGVEIKKQFEVEARARQRAAGGDRSSHEYREQAKALPENFPEALSAEKIGNASANEARQHAAAIVGSNAHYVSDAERILTVSPELGALVREGKLVIYQAKAALKLREAHPGAFAELAAGQIDFADFRDLCLLEESDPEISTRFREGQTTLEEVVALARERKAQARKAHDANLPESEFMAIAAKRVQQPTDCLNRPLDSDLAPIFVDLNEYRALIDELDALRTRVCDFKARRSAAWFDAEATAAHIESAQNQLRFALPICVCPSCGGCGHAQNDGDKQCPTCLSNAFVCAGNFPTLSQELQDIANGYR